MYRRINGTCWMASVLLVVLACGCAEEEEGDELALLRAEVSSLEQELWDYEHAPQSLPLVRGTISIAAGRYYHCPFHVASSTKNVRLKGSFEAVSGGEVVVCVFDDLNFRNWAASADSKALYNSGRLVVGKIDLAITGTGNYHLVFSNTFSWITRKTLKVSVDLHFELG